MYYGYFDPLSIIFHVLEWVVLIWLIVWLIRGSRHERRAHMREMWGGHGHIKAMDLLKERYAKGEINTEEYEEKKKALSE
jgi:putative membrane protein